MTELLAKYFSGNISDADKQKVLDWRNESQQNAEEFFEYASVWNLPGFEKKSELNGSQVILSDILLNTEARETTIAPPQGFNLAPYLKYAAVFVLAVLGTYLVYNQTGTSHQVEVVTGSGETKNITLADGSKVYLNESSILVYDNKEGKLRREVFLTGKAFFEVERDENRPFIVKTKESEVKVLGTSFLVHSNQQQQQTEVVVETGKVALLALNKEAQVEQVELVPGDVGKVKLSDQRVVKSKNADANYLSWKTRHLKFEKDDLEYVFDILEKTYFVDIEVINTNINDCKLSAIYDRKPIQSIMEIVSQTFDLEIQTVGDNKFRLSGSGCTSK